MKNCIIIYELAGSSIVAGCNDIELQNILISLNFSKNKDNFFVKKISQEKEKIHFIKWLMGNYDVLFSDGRGWSPAELILYYREQGLISGKIKIISWRGKDQYNIRVE